jgi:hypothetical protein
VRLKAFFIRPDVTVKVSLKQLVKGSTFRMSGLVLGRRFRNRLVVDILARTEIFFVCMRIQDDRLGPEEHGGQWTSCSLEAATDLIARRTFKPKQLLLELGMLSPKTSREIVALSKWLLAGNCISTEGTSVVTVFRGCNTLNSAGAASRCSWSE